MKRFFTKNIFGKLNIIFLCVLLTAFTGCTDRAPVNSRDRLSVVAVNFYQYDFARAICGSLADVNMIIRPGAEVHGYEPSLSDIIAIEEADVFIYNGGESDVWVERILSSVDTDDMISLSLMKSSGITLYEEEHVADVHSHTDGKHSHDHSHKHGSGGYDEHIWTSPKNAMVIARNIAGAVIEADAKNSEAYRNNLAQLVEELSELDRELAAIAEDSESSFIAVADRFPFLYLAKDYGLEYMAAFSGCSPESDAGPSVIAHMIEEINHHSIDTVFYIELSNEKMADVICEHTGAAKKLLHSCQNVSREDFENGVTYVDLMRNNIRNLSGSNS